MKLVMYQRPISYRNSTRYTFSLTEGRYDGIIWCKETGTNFIIGIDE